MAQKIFSFLSKMPHFSFLPREEITKFAAAGTEKHFPAGTLLALEGETRIDYIFIVTRGKLSLFDENEGRRKRVGYIREREIFGGITILMNSGISLKTVIAENDCRGYQVPADVFQDLCVRHIAFFEYFIENFSHNIFDEALSRVIGTGAAKYFLSTMAPFSFLPEEEIDRIVPSLSIVKYPENTVLFIQGRSRIGHLYILQKGSAERYYETRNKKTMRGILSEGELFGGISILHNDGIAVRSFRVIEPSVFYLLSKADFLSLCDRYPAFLEFFTDIFGKRMLEKSYAAIISKTAQSQEMGSRFFNQPISSICSLEPVFGKTTMSIQETAGIMDHSQISALFLKDQAGDCVGVVTERDLARRVVATGRDISEPASEIMSAPLITFPVDAPIFEACMAMIQQDIRHLAVHDSNNQVIGILSSRDIIRNRSQSPLFLIRETEESGCMAEIIEKQHRLPSVLRELVANGAYAKNLTRFISTFSDVILNKIIRFTLDELGPPPIKFAFMILGSDGRFEQTLKTDQDNAIIYEDIADESEKEINAYFLRFGEKACTLLDQAGYSFCTGGVMAKNPSWCLPLSEWKKNFTNWIHAAGPEDLLNASIFFDFRCGYGAADLVDQLQKFLFESLEERSGFFSYMTENALHFRPPLGFFRNFVVESRGKHRSKFDIKSAMLPIVDFARIYGLKNKIETTNTLERLHSLKLNGVLTPTQYEEIEKAYSFLMQLRLVRQITAILDEGQAPDNYINPKKLTQIEQKMLKEIFKRIEAFQSKMKLDFMGTI
ncbi:MAG: signal transduction protein [Deltaproteobacteria bacterium]|nr:MAG: signal transduction protein [Deltaproteobacteria bacterium]